MTETLPTDGPLGLIAGNGRFPFLVAEAARRQGRRVVLIKLKEVYEFFEATIDSCEDVADVLQNVVVKNS